MAETLAFATLLDEGVPVRLSGQDSIRGTFAHRHAVLVDVNGERRYRPLDRAAREGARFEIYNSPLSEAAVVGFEYGYSRDYPEALVLWEAQFGDFANNAQVIIDQCIASAEDKWRGLSGLTLLLPHGYEGQGLEHSSARVERFLQLSAEDNLQVCQPSTSAQYFHLLRRQTLTLWRTPLVVFTPKSHLRHASSSSSIEEFAPRFSRVLSDGTLAAARRVLICSGKIGHELRARAVARDSRLGGGVLDQSALTCERESSVAALTQHDGLDQRFIDVRRPGPLHEEVRARPASLVVPRNHKLNRRERSELRGAVDVLSDEPSCRVVIPYRGYRHRILRTPVADAQCRSQIDHVLPNVYAQIDAGVNGDIDRLTNRSLGNRRREWRQTL